MNDQPNQPTSLLKRIFSLPVLFLYGNVILMVLFFLVIAKDNVRGWKVYQAEFKKREIARAEKKLSQAATDQEKQLASDELRNAQKMPIEIRQIMAQDLKSVDRCITCHLGFDPLANSSLTTDYSDYPYKASPTSPGLDVHKTHNVAKYGCVVCHGGQGLATEVKAAHGQVLHWEKPLLKGTLLQSSCAKCHDNVKELNVQGKNFTGEIVRAKQLFREHGCIGCHQIGGDGGPVSVDLREETAAKPLSRIDFAYSGLPHEEWTLANWIKIHMVKDPASFVPGDPEAKINSEPIPPSAMPPYLLSEQDAQAITAYILGLYRRDIPSQFMVLRAPESAPTGNNAVERGRLVYEKFGCGGCHGKEDRGGIRNYNYQYDVTPNLRRSVSTYSKEDLMEKIAKGVPIVAKNDPSGPTPPLYMPAWGDKIRGQDMDDLITYLFSIKE